MRNRYLPRSEPLSFDQVLSYARRAAATARSTSSGDAVAISAIFFSVAGEMVENGVPLSVDELAVDEQPVAVLEMEDAGRLGGRGVLQEAGAGRGFDVFHHGVGLQSIVT